MATMDFKGFTFKGQHSSTYHLLRTSDGSRYTEGLLPEFDNRGVDLVGVDGDLYESRRYKKTTFTIKAAFDDLDEPTFRKMRNWLGGNELGSFVFDERPYKTYFVKLDRKPDISYICFSKEPLRHMGEDVGERVYKGEVEMTFIAYDPFGYTVDESYDLNGVIEGGKNWQAINTYYPVIGQIMADNGMLRNTEASLWIYKENIVAYKDWLTDISMPAARQPSLINDFEKIQMSITEWQGGSYPLEHQETDENGISQWKVNTQISGEDTLVESVIIDGVGLKTQQELDDKYKDIRRLYTEYEFDETEEKQKSIFTKGINLYNPGDFDVPFMFRSKLLGIEGGASYSGKRTKLRTFPASSSIPDQFLFQRLFDDENGENYWYYYTWKRLQSNEFTHASSDMWTNCSVSVTSVSDYPIQAFETHELFSRTYPPTAPTTISATGGSFDMLFVWGAPAQDFEPITATVNSHNHLYINNSHLRSNMLYDDLESIEFKLGTNGVTIPSNQYTIYYQNPYSIGVTFHTANNPESTVSIDIGQKIDIDTKASRYFQQIETSGDNATFAGYYTYDFYQNGDVYQPREYEYDYFRQLCDFAKAGKIDSETKSDFKLKNFFTRTNAVPWNSNSYKIKRNIYDPNNPPTDDSSVDELPGLASVTSERISNEEYEQNKEAYAYLVIRSYDFPDPTGNTYYMTIEDVGNYSTYFSDINFSTVASKYATTITTVTDLTIVLDTGKYWVAPDLFFAITGASWYHGNKKAFLKRKSECSYYTFISHPYELWEHTNNDSWEFIDYLVTPTDQEFYEDLQGESFTPSSTWTTILSSHNNYDIDYETLTPQFFPYDGRGTFLNSVGEDVSVDPTDYTKVYKMRRKVSSHYNNNIVNVSSPEQFEVTRISETTLTSKYYFLVPTYSTVPPSESGTYAIYYKNGEKIYQPVTSSIYYRPDAFGVKATDSSTQVVITCTSVTHTETSYFFEECNLRSLLIPKVNVYTYLEQKTTAALKFKPQEKFNINSSPLLSYSILANTENIFEASIIERLSYGFSNPNSQVIHWYYATQAPSDSRLVSTSLSEWTFSGNYNTVTFSSIPANGQFIIPMDNRRVTVSPYLTPNEITIKGINSLEEAAEEEISQQYYTWKTKEGVVVFPDPTVLSQYSQISITYKTPDLGDIELTDFREGFKDEDINGGENTNYNSEEPLFCVPIEWIEGLNADGVDLTLSLLSPAPLEGILDTEIIGPPKFYNTSTNVSTTLSSVQVNNGVARIINNKKIKDVTKIFNGEGEIQPRYYTVSGDNSQIYFSIDVGSYVDIECEEYLEYDSATLESHQYYYDIFENVFYQYEEGAFTLVEISDICPHYFSLKIPSDISYDGLIEIDFKHHAVKITDPNGKITMRYDCITHGDWFQIPMDEKESYLLVTSVLDFPSTRIKYNYKFY